MSNRIEMLGVVLAVVGVVCFLMAGALGVVLVLFNMGPIGIAVGCGIILLVVGIILIRIGDEL